MKSSICVLDGSPASIAAALEEAEHFAHRCGLAQKRLLHLRLLSEELIGMAGGVLPVDAGSFWIEREGMAYSLCLTAHAQAGKTARKLLLDASSTGENVFYKGVTGKIQQAVEWLFQGGGNLAATLPQSDMEIGLLSSQAESEWSLTHYRQTMQADDRAAAWDELEKSVLSRLADDIRVGVREQEIAITILKVFG